MPDSVISTMGNNAKTDTVPGAEVEPALTPAPDQPRIEQQPLAFHSPYSNQQLIDAFFDVANELHNGDYQNFLARAALDIHQLAEDRSARYPGPPLALLPNLSADERQQLHQALIRRLQRRAQPGRVSAPDGANVRAAPGRDQTILTSLPFGSELSILGESNTADADEWLLVSAEEQTGWSYAPLIARGNSPADGTNTSGAAAASFTGPVEAALRLEPPPDASPHTLGAAQIWNHYGSLIEAECQRLHFDPAVAVAILAVESSGRAFEGNRMVIRFENHLFLRYWGQEHRDLFDRHFSGESDGSKHRWRPDPNGEWLPCHTNQATEWQVFEFARNLDERAALYSISMGAAQIMGFNHAAIGYPTPQAMFDAFQTDVRHQIGALFRFIETNHLHESVRVPDFARFARAYNGQGQEAIYAERMQRYYNAYRQLVERARARIARPRLPQPGAPSMLNADPELLAAWRKHIAAGFANNQTLFQRLLNGFLRPYWTTVWMYRILFALGVLSFVLAAALAIFSGRVMPVYTFGGISAIVVLGYLFNRPLQALEQNLQFLTWLGIVYNSYWTRLTLLNNERTVQSDLDEVTGEAIRRIKELVAEHAKRSKTRTGLQLPFDPQ